MFSNLTYPNNRNINANYGKSVIMSLYKYDIQAVKKMLPDNMEYA